MKHRIACYGASNTYGYDPRSYLGERYPAQVRWTDQLMVLCPDREVCNLGENGRKIPRRDWEFQTLDGILRRIAPVSVLTVMLGDNDLLEMASPSAAAVAQRMALFLDWLKAHRSQWGAETQILLIASPPMCQGAWTRQESLLQESRTLGSFYRDLAEKQEIAFADGGAWDVGRTFDGVHFSPEGHSAFAQGVDRALRGLGL